MHAPVPAAHAVPSRLPNGHAYTQYPPGNPEPAETHPPSGPQSESRVHGAPAAPDAVGVTHAPAVQTWPVVQRLPQRPQLAVSLVTSVQVPLHTRLGDGHGVTQSPLVQSCPDSQRLPQRPQLPMSLVTDVQLEPHSTRGAGHEARHVPPPQTWPAAQARLHAPQCAPLVCGSTHVPPQSDCPTGHTQRPPEHAVPSGHAAPHPPQLALSDAVSMQFSPHIERGAAQPVTSVQRLI